MNTTNLPHPAAILKHDKESTIMQTGAHTGWNVYKGSRWLTKVFYTADCDAEYVKDSLVNHDGFAPSIRVYREKPVRA